MSEILAVALALVLAFYTKRVFLLLMAGGIAIAFGLGWTQQGSEPAYLIEGFLFAFIGIYCIFEAAMIQLGRR